MRYRGYMGMVLVMPVVLFRAGGIGPDVFVPASWGLVEATLRPQGQEQTDKS